MISFDTRRIASWLPGLAFSLLLGLQCSTPLATTAQARVTEAAAGDSLSALIASHRCTGEYHEAAQTARDLLASLRLDSATPRWQLGDAERLVATLELIVKLPPTAQQELAAADRLDQEMDDCRAEHNFDAGAQLARRQLTIRRRHLGARHREVAHSLDVLARFLAMRGDLAAALPLRQEALSILRTELEQCHPDLATLLNGLGALHYQAGAYAQVEPCWREALEIRQALDGNQHELVVESLSNLAVLCWTQDALGQAVQYFEQALTLQRELAGADHVTTVSLLYNLALVHETLGDYAAAEPLLRKALSHFRRLHPEAHSIVAQCLNELGNCHLYQRNFWAAEPLYSEALAISRQLFPENHPDVAMCLNNLGLVNLEQEEFLAAETLFRQVLKVYREQLEPAHPDIAMALHNLAFTLMKQGGLQQAESLFQQELSLRRPTGVEQNQDVANCLHDLACTQRDQGRRESAGRHLKEALELYRTCLGEQHRYVALALENLALCRQAEGRYAAAETLLHQASDIFEIARLRAGQGYNRAAFQASPYRQLAITKLALHKYEEAWAATERSLGRALADLLVAAGQRGLDSAEVAREDSLKRSLTQLEGRLTALQAADSDSGSAGVLAAARVQLLEVEAAWSSFQRELLAKYPVTEGQAFSRQHVQTVLDRNTALLGWLTGKDGSGHTVVWGYVVRSSGEVAWVHLGADGTDQEPVADANEIGRFRERLRTAGAWPMRPTATAKIDAGAHSLFVKWFAPLLPWLSGVENLVIIPTGPLLGVPIEPFVDFEGQYLADRYAISYAPSATIFTWLHEQQRSPAAMSGPTALLIGDPPFCTEHLVAMEQEARVLNAPPAAVTIPATLEPQVLRDALAGNGNSLASLPRLRRSRWEVQQVARLVPDASCLLGPEASEPALWRLAASGELSSFSIVHFATHALIDNNGPERSALILSQAELSTEPESDVAMPQYFDGILTVKEIVRHWHLRADLVTLSACETGLGREIRGEGYWGFAHAFLQAGAGSLLVSLWRVEDEAACLLMERFYENLLGVTGNPQDSRTANPMIKAEALQEAKQWLRYYTDPQGNRVFQHPAFWSGFVLIGDRR